MRHRSVLLVLCMAVLVAVVGGCGGAKPPALNTVPVTGTVTHNGQPLEGATVTFYPAESMSGKSAGGTTDNAGKFTLKTLVGGTTMADGAMAGEYNVTVAKDASAEGGANADMEKMTKMSQ